MRFTLARPCDVDNIQLRYMCCQIVINWLRNVQDLMTYDESCNTRSCKTPPIN